MPLLERVRRLLLSPASEWRAIEAEPATVRGLYAGYIAPLAAIGPVAQLLGSTIFGLSIPFHGTVRIPFGSALASAAVTFALTLAATYVLALVIDGLAPTFDGRRHPMQALKLAAYSSTATWVAGIFALMPPLRFLGILGLYSLYLLALGLPVLMKTPKDKSLGYTVAVVLASVVMFFLVGAVGSRLVGIA